MFILVLNAGSSSLKFALVASDTGERPFQGEVERIGTAQATLTTRLSGATTEAQLSSGDHEAALAAVLDALKAAKGLPRIEAVGHRVVHGGEKFTDSVVIDGEVETAISVVSKLAPLHNPANLLGIRAARKALAGLPQVAVFDTAFHHTMEAPDFRYAVPEVWYRAHGVRKYGFHGTSYRYVVAEFARRFGKPLESLQLLVAHLGNGASACAVKHGRSADTTMGLTPLAGLVMGTRSGDVDPGLIAYMISELGIDAKGVTHELNVRSGLLGLSELSNDVRSLLAARADGHPGAALALAIFVRRLASSLLGLTATLDRLDGIVFTAGIGEHAAPIRAEVCARLWTLGARLDPAANAQHGAPTGRISPEGALPIWVIPTDEEWMIARDASRLLAP